MIDTPNHGDEFNPTKKCELDKNSQRQKNWQNFLRWIIYLAFLSLGGSLSYGWYFLTQKLSPLVEAELANFLNRPLELGPVESISLSGVVFGESEIPPTKDDSDRASIQAIKIEINPLKLLAQKKLELNINVIEPEFYLEQDNSDTWIKTQLDDGIPEWNGIGIDIKSINLNNTYLTLKAKSENNKFQPDVKVKLNSSNVYFDPENISFDSKGKLIAGGDIKIDGFYENASEKLSLLINGQSLSAPEINNLLPLPLDLASGTINSNIKINSNPKQAASITGETTLNQVTLNIPNLSQPLTESEGKITFQTNGLNLEHIKTNFGSIPTQVQGLIKYDGEIALKGKVKQSKFNQVINTLNLPQPSVPIEANIEGNLQIKGNVEKPHLTAQIYTKNKATLDKLQLNKAQANLELIGTNLEFRNISLFPTIGGEVIGQGKVNLEDDKPEFLFNINANNISGQKIAQIYEQNLPLEIGKVSGQYNLLGSWKEAKISKVTGTTKVELADGQAIISDLKQNQENWQANLEVTGINLAKIPNDICSKINCNKASIDGEFTVSGKNQVFNSTNIKAKGNANLSLAGEIIRLRNLQLNQGNWQTLIITEGLELATINPNLEFLKGEINSNLNVAGNLNNPNKIMALGKGELITPQGKVTINNFKLQENDFTTEVSSNSLALKSFSSQLQGEASGNLNIKGNINNLNLNEVEIAGDLALNKGIGFLTQPLQTSFNWDGNNLLIKEAKTKEIQAKGSINIDVDNQQVDSFDLDVSAENVDFKTLPFSLPSQLNLLTYQGKFDFQGKVFGNLETPNFLGDIALNNFAVTGFEFNPLVGKIEVNSQEGIKLNLTEKQTAGDLIKISLNSQYQPQEINLKVDNSTVIGVNKDHLFSVSLTDLPLAKASKSLLSLLPENAQNLDGKMSAQFDINLNNYDFYAPQITIKNPVFANFKGDLIKTELAYREGKLNFNEGKITKNESDYLFEGEVYPLEDNPQFEAKLAVEKGNIQDLLQALEFFNWSDFKRGMNPPQYATAKDLYAQDKAAINENNNNPSTLLSVGKENAPFGEQLAYFNKISQLVAQKQAEKLAASIPELEELKGNFDGTLDVSGSLKEGIKTEFDFQGKNWHLGRYQADSVQVKGNYEDGLLTFLPIKIQHQQTLFSLLGSFHKNSLSGQVKVVDLPIDAIQQVIDLPDLIGLGGMLNATVAVSGSEESPLAKGEISISDATINDTKIKSNQASFSYKNSRLDFFANSILDDTLEPLTVKGSFPYQLFSNSIAPASNKFDLSLKMKDEMFSLLNAITNKEVQWLQGKGNLNLDVHGNYNQDNNQFTNIHTDGVAIIENAQIAAKVLPDKPLSNINGKILFDFDQIKVENFTAKFSGGDINIIGSLPLINNDHNSSQDNPLTVNVENLALNLEELYEGDVNGNLKIIGTAIAPKIAGNLELFNGQISLPEEVVNKDSNTDNELVLANTKFQNLNLILGSNIKIVKAPLLSVVAKGNLRVSGSFAQPQPEGNIHLTKGQVNLFTSQLKLAEDHQNIAKFTKTNGLDPYLDIELLASVTETNRHQFVKTPVASEIKDVSNSELEKAQTIRVKANVKGLSSQLTNKLELKSSPQRSESEIIALLGGGFFNNFSQSNNTIGLANLASAAFFGSFQGQLGDALGLSEFRLFPTQVINSDKRTSSLNLGAEIGVDIGKNFSVSVMKILTNEQAPQYSIRYHLNEQTLLRGSSDFNKDSRGSIEFEKRF